MTWRITDKIQTPGALLVKNISDFERIFLELKSRPSLHLNCRLARGMDWLALFGQDISGEVVLPHIPESIALYQMYEDVWTTVGARLDLPETIHADYIDQFRAQHDISDNPIFVVPQFNQSEVTNEADIYHIIDTALLKSIVTEVAA